MRRVNTHRQPYTNVLRLLVLTIVSLLLTGCSGLVNIVTATPNEVQSTVIAVTNAPAENETGNVSVTKTATRRPRSTATPAATNRVTTPTAKSAKPTRTPTVVPSTVDGLKTISPVNLPPEAQQTLALIDSGGPFPYSRDGIVFQNREGILPNKSASYYHEYTVVTPGSADRGARRLIAGSKGEIYYTDDHYVTFMRVIR